MPQDQSGFFFLENGVLLQGRYTRIIENCNIKIPESEVVMLVAVALHIENVVGRNAVARIVPAHGKYLGGINDRLVVDARFRLLVESHFSQVFPAGFEHAASRDVLPWMLSGIEETGQRTPPRQIEFMSATPRTTRSLQ